VRPNTERPVTLTEGTNQLVECDKDRILAAARDALDGDRAKASRPEGWDGKAAERIVDYFLSHPR
jgi:UDP-N-acetylglucosamine 2-epimerase (non-hydrolysing)